MKMNLLVLMLMFFLGQVVHGDQIDIATAFGIKDKHLQAIEDLKSEDPSKALYGYRVMKDRYAKFRKDDLLLEVLRRELLKNEKLEEYLRRVVPNIDHGFQNSSHRSHYARLLYHLRTPWSVEILSGYIFESRSIKPDSQSLQSFVEQVGRYDAPIYPNPYIGMLRLSSYKWLETPKFDTGELCFQGNDIEAPEQLTLWRTWWTENKESILQQVEDYNKEHDPLLDERIKKMLINTGKISPEEVSRPPKVNPVNSSPSKQEPSSSNYLWIPLLIAFILGVVFLKRKIS